MVVDAMNGLMEASMRAILSTASSKVKVNKILKRENQIFSNTLLLFMIHYILGVYYFAESERTYEGNFSQNLFEGKGKLTYKDGRQYEGDFKAGKKDG